MKLKIEKLIYRGSGVGESDGKKIFVPFTAPGDVVEVEIVDDHGSYAEAKIVKIFEPSKCRVVPRCPVFGQCGGCQWQHLSYETQIEWKRKILIETLRRIGKIDLNEQCVLPVLRSPNQWHYRNRIQLHVDSRGRVGFYRAQSKEVVEFEECLIAEEELNDQLRQIRPTLKGRDRGIALRKDGGPSFFQINTLQNEQLKETVAEWLKREKNDNILELYAGSGNFTFVLSQFAKNVIASDIDGRAIRSALAKKTSDKIGNVEFYCEGAAKTFGRIGSSFDVLVLDPPRKGAQEIIEAILAHRPTCILYISCDPATLSRDIRLLIDGGYKLEKVMPVDMFPQTYHIESITLLRLN